MPTLTQVERNAEVVEVSKHVLREIERDLFRSRGFGARKVFSPSSLSFVNRRAA